MRLIKAAVIILGVSTPVFANESLSVAIDLAEQAIDKGHGAMCDLEMKPVRTGGYYPCLDFGPYRYVREYNRISGYVIEKGKRPFSIFTGTREKPIFLYDGPWTTDVVSRMVIWWNDNTGKNSDTYNKKMREQAALSAASKYISSLNEQPTTESPAKTPPSAREEQGKPKSNTEVMTDDIRSILGQQ